MKKKLLFLTLLLVFFPVAKAQYNLFEAADVDAEGWLWFNTQAKIDKYIGVGKAIELQAPAFDTDAEVIAGADIVGAGTDKLVNGTAALTGSILLTQSSVTGVFDGGGILMYLPSCTELSLFLSSKNNMMPAVYGAPGRSSTKDLAIIKAYTVFNKLSVAGQKKWENIQNLTNANSYKLNSSSAVTALIRNGVKDTLYIHGIKVMTSTPPLTSINNLAADVFKPIYRDKTLMLNQVANIQVSSLYGRVVTETIAKEINLAHLSKGVYIVRIKNDETEGTTKILVY